jgi:hypothetical protein
MANCGKEILIPREGTEQQQRFIDALNPDFFKLNDLGLKEWMQFAYNFAVHVKYFDTLDDKNATGDWTEFFKKDTELDSFIESVNKDHDITPHLALFVCFVKLIEITQGHFNKLTKKHLDFYYNKILGIEKLPAKPDTVHVIFELAKNSFDTKIAQNSELDGGKDTTGKKLIYKTTEELVANKIKLTQVRSIYNDQKFKKIKAAEVANSYDGNGSDFPNGEIKWWPFGYYEDKEELKKYGKVPTYPELKDARLGFALSSKIFELSEGERNVQITLEFSDTLDGLEVEKLQSNLEAYCSGEKGWLGHYNIQSQIDGTTGTGTGTNADSTFVTKIDSTKKFLKLAFQIGKDEKAVVNYNQTILGEYFNSELPVCRFLFKTENIDGYAQFMNLVEKRIENITVDIDVKGIKNLSIENDIGVLNVKKPFYPFGTLPVKGSNFYIDNSEAFKKNWGKIDIALNWKNTPVSGSNGEEAFVNLYSAYTNDFLNQSSLVDFSLSSPSELIVQGNDYFTANVDLINYPATNGKDIKFKKQLQNGSQTEENSIQNSLTKNEINPGNKDIVPEKNLIHLFQNDESSFFTNFSLSNNNPKAIIINGPIKLSLNQSFLHELFQRIYALAFGNKEAKALVPNEPYTPLAESITLNYTAQTTSILVSSKDGYQKNDIKLFHEHPFGQSEEHPYLKSQLDFIDSEDLNTYLVPTYCKGGELYLGFENAQNLQQVSLLIQLLEGSENPDADSFVGKQGVEWSILCNNNWKSLDSNYMISNETDNFLKSGIVKFTIPNEASANNTLLAKDLIWVEAKIYKNYDAICKAISIQSQAVDAKFYNNGNEMSHLKNGLAAKSISKLIQRIPTVKGVSQPYNSFDGIPEESDFEYYRRISERLRHKHRAITVWDYEHIILQQFPDIHKVKCLNHSTEDSALSPGNILIIVIPDIINKNVFDIYQPRVSKATLNKVQEYINQLNTLHVNATVKNPTYEEVTIELNAKFNDGYDENYYLKVLKDDISRFLSPWAYERTASIEFGVTLHRSTLINYIEKLGYVDFVEEVKLKKSDGISQISIEPSSQKAILVSSNKHSITSVTEYCTKTTEPQETCQ